MGDELPPGTVNYLEHLKPHYVSLQECIALALQQGFIGSQSVRFPGVTEDLVSFGGPDVGLLVAHGEHFYNFQGLRAFKEKFVPEWEARYLAAPGGLTPLFVLADVAALVSGGMRGVIAK